jgi:ABC-2 type transport system permease protein
MLFSEVWFSLEGTHPLLQQLAQLLPLTQLLEAARAVMLDGAGFQDVRVELFALGGMSLLFLALGGLLFKWNPE